MRPQSPPPSPEHTAIHILKQQKELLVEKLANVNTEVHELKTSVDQLKTELGLELKAKKEQEDMHTPRPRPVRGRYSQTNSEESLHPQKQMHPWIEGIDPVDSKAFYAKIAEIFPNMTLATVVDSERRFLAADSRCDGLIDVDELDSVLTESITMFTPAIAQEIVNSIDMHDDGSIDFLQVLNVVDKLKDFEKSDLAEQVMNKLHEGLDCRGLDTNITEHVSASRGRLCSIQ